MIEREYVDASGIPWSFVERKRVRKDEVDRFVVIMASSPFETRVIRCEREQWITDTPDYAQLLATSLPAGGSTIGIPRSSPTLYCLMNSWVRW